MPPLGAGVSPVRAAEMCLVMCLDRLFGYAESSGSGGISVVRLGCWSRGAGFACDGRCIAGTKPPQYPGRFNPALRSASRAETVTDSWAEQESELASKHQGD